MPLKRRVVCVLACLVALGLFTSARADVILQSASRSVAAGPQQASSTDFGQFEEARNQDGSTGDQESFFFFEGSTLVGIQTFQNSVAGGVDASSLLSATFVVDDWYLFVVDYTLTQDGDGFAEWRIEGSGLEEFENDPGDSQRSVTLAPGTYTFFVTSQVVLTQQNDGGGALASLFVEIEATEAPDPEPIPEPALAGLALVGALALRSRRR